MVLPRASRYRPSKERRRPSCDRPASSLKSEGLGLDRVADGREDLRNLAAQEDQGDDGHDGDESKDQRVLREALALLLVAHDKRRDECVQHCEVYLLSPKLTPFGAAMCHGMWAGGSCQRPFGLPRCLP